MYPTDEEQPQSESTETPLTDSNTDGIPDVPSQEVIDTIQQSQQEEPLAPPTTADIILETADELSKLDEYAERKKFETESEIAKQEILQGDDGSPGDSDAASKQKLIEERRAYEAKMLAERHAHEERLRREKADYEEQLRAKKQAEAEELKAKREKLDAERRAEQERLRAEREAMDAKLKAQRDAKRPPDQNE